MIASGSAQLQHSGARRIRYLELVNQIPSSTEQRVKRHVMKSVVWNDDEPLTFNELFEPRKHCSINQRKMIIGRAVELLEMLVRIARPVVEFLNCQSTSPPCLRRKILTLSAVINLFASLLLIFEPEPAHHLISRNQECAKIKLKRAAKGRQKQPR